QLVESGATRAQGVVKRLNNEYGFLQPIMNPMAKMYPTTEADEGAERGERLRAGAQAEFWIVPDRNKDGKESFRALEVKLLPPGTLVLEELTHSAVKGVLERPPTFPQRQRGYGGGGGGGPGEGGGGIQPGLARFCTPLQASEEEARQERYTCATIHPKEMKEVKIEDMSNVPTLEEGDVLEADLWLSKLGEGKMQARNIKVVSLHGPRCEGVVLSLLDGFGFMRQLDHGSDVFFRVADIYKGIDHLEEGSGCVFNLSNSTRGDKQRATRVEVLKKGTLDLERIVARGVCGVVTKEAKGSGMGSIVCTDGNTLQLPMDARFPQLAATIKAFAEQDEEKELILPSSMGPAERLGAHCLCGEAGLGHESKGEEPNRSLRVWKPETPEETVAIRDADMVKKQKRIQQAKDRSKDADRSVSISFVRGDCCKPTTPTQGGEGAGGGGEGEKGGVADTSATNGACPSVDSAGEGKRKREGRMGWRGNESAAPQRGDLVMFDVVFDRGTLKKRATSVQVTKKATAAAEGESEGMKDVQGLGLGLGLGLGRKELLQGVVSLVQTERHFGFIEVIDRVMDKDERVFFHLSEVINETGDEVLLGNVQGFDSSPLVGPVPVTVQHFSISGGAQSSSSSRGTGNVGDASISQGQEVSFRLGQRQGKTVAVSVRKLPQGSLSLEEAVPGRYLGVVVVAPRS
ncbi:unnamed protein product, partial [Discosporangium mesarthrocarpum]